MLACARPISSVPSGFARGVLVAAFVDGAVRSTSDAVASGVDGVVLAAGSALLCTGAGAGVGRPVVVALLLLAEAGAGGALSTCSACSSSLGPSSNGGGSRSAGGEGGRTGLLTGAGAGVGLDAVRV
jgi:hypothetical protein